MRILLPLAMIFVFRTSWGGALTNPKNNIILRSYRTMSILEGQARKHEIVCNTCTDLNSLPILTSNAHCWLS
jgi:hypothetical protein